MRYVLLLSAVIFLQNPSPRALKASSPEQKHADSSHQITPNNQCGTQDSPVFVKVIPTSKTPEETAQEAAERNDKSASDWWLVRLTGILAVMAIIQTIVFGYQGSQLKKTVEAAEGQSKDMKSAIVESARTAKAMEDVAKHFDRSVTQAENSTDIFQERGKQQTRAYVCVEVGTAAYQDRATNTKFAAQTLMVDAGNTPAHNVRFRAKAAILSVPLPDDFAFPLPAENVGGSVLGPHQKLAITQVVDDFVPDTEIENIKKASGTKALYIWGIISYRDVFNEEHITRFCQLLYWLPGEKIMGTYIARHNDAT